MKPTERTKVKRSPKLGLYDDKADYELDIWAGVLPVDKKYGQEIVDEKLKAGIPTPNSVNQPKK